MAFVEARGCFRLACVALAMLLTASAFGNAAMGLAYEIFELPYWFVYVILTVILEAWLIGRAFGTDWPRSLGWSLLANFLTAFCCSSGQLIAPFLHRMDSDPNPLLWTIEVLTFFGIVSACFEAMLWRFRPLRFEPAGKVWGRTFLAHLVGIPLALVILLIPPHPYRGVEATVSLWRRVQMESDMKKVLRSRVDDNENFKQFKDFSDLARAFEAQGFDSVGLYQPDYDRFSTHDTRTKPLTIRFYPVDPKDPDDQPLITIHYPYLDVSWTMSEILAGTSPTRLWLRK